MFLARALTTLVGMPIVLALVWLGSWPFAFAAAVVAALAASEASRAFGSTSEPRRSTTWLMAFCAVLLTWLGFLGTNALLAGIAVLMLIWIGVALFSVLTAAWATQFTALLYVALPLALLVVLRTESAGNTGGTVLGVQLTGGTTWTLLLLTSVWAVDVCAYLVGRAIGRRQLWPRISPKKTWEGTVAGVLGGSLVWLAWAPLLGLSPPVAGIAGLVMSIAAVFGDLAESAIKRAAGLKDASSLLPGHGGLLDRLDSLGFATVVVFLCRMLLGN